MEFKKSRRHEATWLGRRGVTYEWRAGRALGLRVDVHHWLDAATESNGGHPAGTTVVRLIEGDGRSRDFKEHARRVLPPGDASWELRADEAAWELYRAHRVG